MADKIEKHVDPGATERPANRRPLRVNVPQRNQAMRKFGTSLDSEKPKKPAPTSRVQGDGAVGAVAGGKLMEAPFGKTASDENAGINSKADDPTKA